MKIDPRLFAGMDGEISAAAKVAVHLEDHSLYGATSASDLGQAMDAVLAFLIKGQEENDGESSIDYVMAQFGKYQANLEAIRKDSEDETTVFTVHDHFADCTYIKATIEEAKRVADNIVADLIVEVKNNDLNKVVARYFRNGDLWAVNICLKT